MDSSFTKLLGPILAATILVSGGVGYVAGQYGTNQVIADFKKSLSDATVAVPAGQNQDLAESKKPGETVRVITQEQQITEVVLRASPAVVSVIVTKDLPIIEQFEVDPLRDFFGSDPFLEQFLGPRLKIPQFRQKGTQRREVGGGTGFILSANGLIMTNRHVVQDTAAEYTVLTNEGEKLPSKVLARHPVLDLAILKVEKNNLTTLPLGDSDALKSGQTVIAIGNALGEFRNTVSVGVISGLRRNITAGGGGVTEELEDVIQTDAAINPGNSGGPLLNIKGEIIGVNVAVALGAENVGFSIPINGARKIIEEVRATGKLEIPFLGVRYVIINDAIARANSLPVNYGAIVVSGGLGEPAVEPNSPAALVGLKENDIITEFDGAKIDEKNTLAKLIVRKRVGDEAALKVLHNGEILTLRVRLGER